MSNLKKFIGEYAYNIIKNMAVDNEKIRKALVTPQNAREVFSELTEFEVRSLCTEISSSVTIGRIRETTQQEIINAFRAAGYDRVIFDDENAIAECRKYYKAGEVICTYNNLKTRMREYHMLVAIKANIDEIKRSERPDREDEYGTSILNIQIARNGSHMSIKNRYNHTVNEPDSTLNNNLDILYPELQSMVLGYYGFASLGNKKSHYKNIVNIDGVYLKYYAERNNIYFGTFVLDGVNGVRFDDASQYYVTLSGVERDNVSPLILDFKAKKTIDLLEKTRHKNTRASLLSRAMQEGILTSRNKDETNTLSAVFYNAKKELLQCNKNALRYIHEVFGYDFMKPYVVTAILGKFTAKSITKITGNNTGILFVCEGSSMRICQLNKGTFEVKDIRSNYSYNIDNFYIKSDFELVRKSGHAAVYIIQQNNQYIGTPKLTKGYYVKPELDKSGFNITQAKQNLYQKLRQYKCQKRLKEVSEIDFTQDLLDIEKSFAELKSAMITWLTKADTYEDYRIFESVTNYRLGWLVRDIEEIQDCVQNKNFSSIDSANKLFDSVKSRLANMRDKISKE